MARINPTGKPILITGASSGIGRATAVRCAEAGMPVAACARREDKLREVCAEIEQRGVAALPIALDVDDAQRCAEAVEAAERELGPLHAVFANAGYGLERPVNETSDEVMRAIFETNFYGSLNIIRPALPGMIQRGAGHVLICSSCIARFPLPYYGAYSATKAAQHHIGRAMNLELRPLGVRVSTVHPVGTKTEFFDIVNQATTNHALVSHTPSMLMQPADRVARAVVRCIRRPRPEVWTSPVTRLGMAISAVFPGLADTAVRGMIADYERKKSGAG